MTDNESEAAARARLGGEVRRLRRQQSLTLDDLARRSGVSKAMISRIERGEASPTAHVVGKLAEGLDVSISRLMGVQDRHEVIVMRAAAHPSFKDDSGRFERRCLSPLFPTRGVDVVLNILQPGGSSGRFVPHRVGVEEHLIVASGRLAVILDGTEHRLEAGDSIFFEAHVAHEFRNLAKGETRFYIVIDSSRLRS